MNASYRERRGLDTPTEKLQSYAFALKDRIQNFHHCIKPSQSVYHCLIQPTFLPVSVRGGYMTASENSTWRVTLAHWEEKLR